MKGSIVKRGPNWAIILDIHDATTGRRRRKWHSFRGTKREAENKCAELISKAQTGTAIEPTKNTLREYLGLWLDHISNQVSPSSCESYRKMVTAYIVPALGNTVLSKLAPAAIAKAYSDAKQHGRKGGKGGLSANSIRLAHRVLSAALKQAVIWKLLPNNPCVAVKPPRIERKQMKVLDAEQTAALIEFARSHPRMFVPVLLGAFCGLRRGEVAALCWKSVNLDAGQLAVVANTEQTKALGCREKPPKSDRARTVALPAIVVEEPRRHRISQAESLLRLGVRQTDATHVCLLDTGEPWSPHGLTLEFRRLIKASGLPRIRLHGLRHGHATHLLAANIHPKVVQERLGHSSIAITLDLYSHVLPGLQQEAAASIDATLGSALKRRRDS